MSHEQSRASPLTPAPELRTFRGAGGDVLGYVVYRAQHPRKNVALVYLHGIESHTGWFDGPARLLCQQGYDVYCPDRRGSGINREARGFRSGHADSFRVLFADIAAFIAQLDEPRQVFLVGLSWGGKLATGFALERPRRLHGLILIMPGLKARVDAGWRTKLQIAASLATEPTRVFPIPIRPTMFTTTPRFLAFIREDPSRLHGATARFFFESRRLERFIETRIANSKLPMLAILAGQDRIVDNEAVTRLLKRAWRAPLDVIEYHDQSHSIQFDAPHRLVADITRWLERNGR